MAEESLKEAIRTALGGQTDLHPNNVNAAMSHGETLHACFVIADVVVDWIMGDRFAAWMKDAEVVGIPLDQFMPPSKEIVADMKIRFTMILFSGIQPQPVQNIPVDLSQLLQGGAGGLFNMK
jgi:hypothetical protein